MEKIKLNDILRLNNLDKVKIRFNLSNNSWNALKLYQDNPTLLLIGNFHNSPKKDGLRKMKLLLD